MHEQEHPSATYDSGATRRQKVVLISRQGDSARTLAATLCTHADSTTMVVADEAPRGPLVPWHAARIPDWVSLPARIVRGIETAGADRASLAAVVFQSRHATVDSEEDLFVGVLPRPLDARVYTAPVVLALRADVDAGDNIAWLDMDAEACDLMLDSWLAGPLLDADTCATARTEFDADSSAMSTDDERHTNAEVAPPATTTTTDDDDERQGTDGGTPAARAALKARRRGRATPTPRRKSRRDRATAVADDDDRSSHATDDEDAPAPPRRLRASRRAPRHVAGERDDEGDEDDENNGGGGGGLADDVGRGVEEDDDDDVCRDDSDDDLRTAEADDDLGDDDMSDVGDNDDVDDDDGDLDGIGGANGDMDDDLADDEEGDMDDDPNAE